MVGRMVLGQLVNQHLRIAISSAPWSQKGVVWYQFGGVPRRFQKLFTSLMRRSASRPWWCTKSTDQVSATEEEATEQRRKEVLLLEPHEDLRDIITATRGDKHRKGACSGVSGRGGEQLTAEKENEEATVDSYNTPAN